MLIFTDLDATLLDHETYSAEDAMPVLAELSRRGISVIPVTSKTRAEVLAWRDQLRLEGPYVIENGAGIYVPATFARVLEATAPSADLDVLLGESIPYGEIRSIFRTLAARYPILGFGDMALQEIASLTGLPPRASAQACQREFSEPFLLRDPSAFDGLERDAASHGLRILRGGRFYHLLDARAGKGEALRTLCAAYERVHHKRPITLALGDSPSDLEMLQAADRGIVIPRSDGSMPEMDLTGLEVALYPGPRGWAEAVRRVVG